MFIIVIMLIAGLIGGFMAQAKGKSVLLWVILAACFPIALIFLAFMGKEEAAPAQPQEADMHRWNTLVELDPEIAAAAKAAREAGAVYERQLAAKYLTLNDKRYLPAALAHVLEQAMEDGKFPSTGELGGSAYRREPNGTYVIVSGSRVGSQFKDFEKLQRTLG